MPTYEFRCKSCGQTLIEYKSIIDPSQSHDCPMCGKTMIRVYAAPGLTFNGTGWGKD